MYNETSSKYPEIGPKEKMTHNLQNSDGHHSLGVILRPVQGEGERGQIFRIKNNYKCSEYPKMAISKAHQVRRELSDRTMIN